MDNSTYEIGPLVVWTLPATGASGHLLTANAASFPWGWGWIKEPMLQATGNRFTKRPGAMGMATLTILRDQRQEPGDTSIRAYNSPLVAGQYVCITADSDSPDAGQLDPALILWWGWISSISYSQIAGTLDGVGTATALEVGHLLDQQQVVNWLEASADGLSGEPVTAPPTANLGDSASYIIGNATPNVGIGSGGDLGYAFTRLPDDCGNADGDLWTRWRLLRHLLYGCWPGGLPVPTLACADGSEGAAGPQDNDPTGGIAGFLNDTDTPEVFDLRNLTLKGAIDLCVPRSRGFNWTLELIDTKGWQVVVYSYATLGGSGGLPVNGTNDFFDYISPAAGTDLTVDSFTTDVKVVSDSGTMPDEVVVEGSPIVIGNTVSFADGNLTIGWQRGTGNQEDAFRLGASTAADYSSLTDAQKLERNASVRASAGLRDVYTRYGLYAYDPNGDISVLASPGPGGGGQSYSLCPQLNWDGAALAIDATHSRCPYLPASTLARTLPWPEGVKGNGTDLRPVQNRYLPQFLKPKILRYDPSVFIPWVDFEAQNGRSGSPSMSLDVDDRGMAFRVTLSSPIYLAYRHWTDPAGGTTSPAAADINPDVDPMAVDFTKLVATVGVESDQRVRVAIKRPGVANDAQVRRRLVLREPALQCWIMRAGAIIGLLPDGTPERITGGGAFSVITGTNGDAAVAIRNDFPAAQKRCDMAAAWAFRERNSVVVQRAAPDSPPIYARIGYLITNLVESNGDRINAAASLVVNTVVEEVTYDFTMRPRISIGTAMPDALGFAAIGGGGSGGGQVSAMLGGTVGQAVQTQQQVTSGLNRDTQRVPVISPQFSPKSDAANYNYFITPTFPAPHGFIVGDAVSFPDGVPLSASKTTSITAGGASGIRAGVVIDVPDPNNCTIALRGYFDVPSSPFNIGIGFPWYLTSTAGTMTYVLGSSATEVAGNPYLRPMMVAEQDAILVFGNYLNGDSSSINALADVGLGTLANDDALTWDATHKFWANKPVLVSSAHAATSVLGRSAATSGTAADITATADNQVLVRIAGTLQWAALPVAALANVAATTVLGNATNASAAVTAIAAAADNTVMLRTSGTLSFGQVPNAALVNSSLTVNSGTGLSGGGSIALGATITLNVSGVPNSALANSAVTVAAGTGLSGGGAISLGGSTTLSNAGVLSVTGTSPVVSSGGQNPAISIAAHGITPALFQQSVSTTVICNPTNATADIAGLTATADGQILQRAGGVLVWAGIPFYYTNSQVYSASTTFTIPAGVTAIFAVVIGSGGGSAGSAAAGTAPWVNIYGGAGGGAAAAMGFAKVAVGQVLTITIGAVGTAGASGGGSGGNGGFSALSGSSPTVSFSANGGGGGSPGIPGQGGSSSGNAVGTWAFPGQAGGAPWIVGSTFTAVAVQSISFGGGKGGYCGGMYALVSGIGGDGVTGPSTAGNVGTIGTVVIFY